MHIIFFTHPNFFNSNSMPRYANWLKKGMLERGHSVEVWTASRKLLNITNQPTLKKWLGYVDQYLIFPCEVKKRQRKTNKEVIYVITDHALGPWVYLVSNKNHVVHCHDFLAQKSALGEIKENKTGFSGIIYQKIIRKGFRKAKNFICISEKTKDDLLRFLELNHPKNLEVIYNGLNQQFIPLDKAYCRKQLSKYLQLDLFAGYILHVGGNQWYKNRIGVIEIYEYWRENYNEYSDIPLLLVGQSPSESLLKKRKHSKYSSDIFFLSSIDDEMLKSVYAGAAIFLFPSLAEGFGWPIAESMASGVPVITTNEKPMTEVGGDAVFYIPRKMYEGDSKFLLSGAEAIDEILSLSKEKLELVVEKGIDQAHRFNPEMALNLIEKFYKKIIS